MKSFEEDGGECWRKWYNTRRANLLRISGEPPKNLCIHQLSLIVSCRYAEELLKNRRVKRYLSKYHEADLRKLEIILESILQPRDNSAHPCAGPGPRWIKCVGRREMVGNSSTQLNDRKQRSRY